MSVFDSPLLVAVSPVIISSLVTLYAIHQNHKITPTEHNELIKELKKEIRELKEK